MITPTPLHNSLYRAATQTPMLGDAAHEITLVARAKAGDKKAMDTLVRSYMRLIVSLSRKFAPNADPNDLVNEGVMGFIQAIERFDPEAGFRLGTYARHWVLDRLKEHTRKVRSVVGMGGSSERRRGIYHLGPAIERVFQEARNAGETLTYYQALQRAAESLSMSVENAENLMARAGGDMSLNAPLGGEDGESMQWQDALVDESPNPEQAFHRQDAATKRSALIEASMAGLSARERRIVIERRLSDNPVTLDALGAEFQISKERVRQIEKRALEKMAAAIQEHRAEAINLV